MTDLGGGWLILHAAESSRLRSSVLGFLGVFGGEWPPLFSEGKKQNRINPEANLRCLQTPTATRHRSLTMVGAPQVNCSALALPKNFRDYIDLIRDQTSFEKARLMQCRSQICSAPALWGTDNPDISGRGVSQLQDVLELNP